MTETSTLQARSASLHRSHTLPSETDARFMMLIVSALCLTIHIAAILVISFSLLEPSIAAQMEVVRQTSEALSDGGIFSLSTLERFVYAAQQHELSLAGLRGLWPIFAIPLLAVCGLWAGASLIYRTHPRRLLYRLPVRTITPHDLLPLPDLDLAATGIQLIHIVPRDAMLSAVAWRVFGFPGRYQLLIFGKRSLVERCGPARFFALMWEENAPFRTSVLHEVGHIYNGDIWHGYFSEAMWLAFMVLIVVPGISLLMLGVALGHSAGVSLIAVVRLLLLVAVVGAIWAGLLRTREYYADWWVAEQQSDHTTLFQFFQRGTTLRRAEPGFQRFWRHTPWSTHPQEEMRAAHLHEPTRLFQVSPGLALLSGTLLSILAIGMPLISLACGMLIVLASSAAMYKLLLMIGAAELQAPHGALKLLIVLGGVAIPGFLMLVSTTILPAWLISRILGIQIQRELLTDRQQPLVIRPYVRLLLRAILFTAGLVGGLLVMPFSFFAPRNTLGIAVALLLSVLFSGCIWIWMAYVRVLGWFKLKGSAELVRVRAQAVTRRAAGALTVLLCAFLPPLIGVIYDPRVVDLLPLGANRDDFVIYSLGGSALFPSFFCILLFALYVVTSLLLAWRADKARGRLSEGTAQGESYQYLVPEYDQRAGPPEGSQHMVHAATSQCSEVATIGSIVLALGSLACLLGSLITLVFGVTATLPPDEPAFVQALWPVVVVLIPAGMCVGGLVLMAIAMLVSRRQRLHRTKMPTSQGRSM